MTKIVEIPDQVRASIAYATLRDLRSQHVALSLDLIGELDLARIRDGLEHLARRHPALGARIARVDGLPTIDLATPTAPTFVAEAVAPERLDDFIGAAIAEPFDPSESAMRIRIATIGPDRHVLVLVMPRALADRASLVRLFDEWLVLSNDPCAVLSPVSGVAAHASSESARRTTDEYRDALDTSASSLRGAPTTIALPAIEPRPVVFQGRGATLRIAIEPAVVRQLEEVARGVGVSIDDVVLTAFLTRLARSGESSDVVIGLETKTDARFGVAPSIGPAVIRPGIDLLESFRTALANVAACRATAVHREVSFADLLDALAPSSDRSRVPVVHALFEREPAVEDGRSFAGATIRRRPVANEGARADLVLRLVPTSDGFELALEFAHDVHEVPAAERMLAGVSVALAAVSRSLDLPAGRIDILAPEERALAFSLVRRDTLDVDRPWFARMHEHVRATPDAVAMVFEGRTFSYAEVDASANRLANRLVKLGVSPGDRVAIHCGRSPSMFLSVLAVHLTGAAYVPIDPTYPAERIRMILDDASPSLMISDATIANPTLGRDLRVVLADDRSIDEESADPLGIAVDPRALAYIIFTSGSTGRPKGVAIEHRSLTNTLHSMAVAPGLAPSDRMLAITSFSFDVSLPDLTLAWFVGASVEVADSAMAVIVERLAAKLEDPSITVVQATPSTYRMLLEHGFAGRASLRLFCGGEAMNPELVAALVPRAAEVWNNYGPTETTVWSTTDAIRSPDAPVSLGKPFANTSIYVLDANGEPVPTGSIGEIHIGGFGVARGYFGREDLTAARFVPDPFAPEPDARMYRTGDLARFRPDGSLDYLGRSDFQVKIRGFRIELGEIESAILLTPGVRQTVVLAREDVPGDLRLVAYLVGDPDAADVALRAELEVASRVPKYMVPTSFITLDSFPLTPSCKIDRKALPAPQASTSGPGVAAIVADDVEAAVLATFIELLRTSDLDVDTSFFDAGGNSLLAVRLAKQLDETLGVRIDLARIFETPSVRGLAAAVRDRGVDTDRPRVVVLRRGTTDRSVFCLSGVALYQHLARGLPSEFSVYGIYLPAEAKLFDPSNLRRGRIEYASVAELAAMYVDAMRSVQPRGPYRILGVSFGGVVAYEAARQLSTSGESVAFLGLLDALLSGAHGGSLVLRLASRALGLLKNPVSRRVVVKLARARLGGVDPSYTDGELDALRDLVQEFELHRYERKLPGYRGTALVVHADDRTDFANASVDAGFGWRDAVEGGIHEVVAPGDHLGMLTPPHVEGLVAVLAPHLA